MSNYFGSHPGDSVRTSAQRISIAAQELEAGKSGRSLSPKREASVLNASEKKVEAEIFGALARKNQRVGKDFAAKAKLSRDVPLQAQSAPGCIRPPLFKLIPG